MAAVRHGRVEMNLLCSECGAPMYGDGLITQTIVGYGRAECGRSHDDNCRIQIYLCPHGHQRRVSKRNSCECGWKGKTTCFCHDGEKFDEWPEGSCAVPQ